MDHTQTIVPGDPIPLWPNGAPGALGDQLADRPHLVPYILPRAQPGGAIVICPGGAYACQVDHEREPIARWVNSLGLSAIVLLSRVAPYRHPHPLHDALRAMRLIRSRAAQWQLDPARIVILGFSAGGHLAASAAALFDEPAPPDDDLAGRFSARPDAVILAYPVITFGDRRHNGSMENLLGPNPPSHLRNALSLETRVTPRTPPAFLWHTFEDAAVPIDNSILFAQALHRAGVNVELHGFPTGYHGLSLAPDHPAGAWKDLCARWLRERGILA